jgi:hypothetical protein
LAARGIHEGSAAVTGGFFQQAQIDTLFSCLLFSVSAPKIKASKFACPPLKRNELDVGARFFRRVSFLFERRSGFSFKQQRRARTQHSFIR